MSELIGYSNYIKDRLDTLTNTVHIMDDLIAERNAIIAHRFSKNTAQPYSLSLLRNIIDRGIRLIEFDVSETQDTDPNDRVFFLSHGTGGLEEIAPEDRPAEITKDTYNKSIINFNNKYLNNADTLPSLREAWNMLKNEEVVLLMEAKTTNTTGLINYCENVLKMDKSRVIFQDFDNSQLTVFKNAGYKTMKLSSGPLLSTQEIADYDYYCVKGTTANANAWQADSRISQFFLYTSNSPAYFGYYLGLASKVVGCFSDCALADYKKLTVPDRSLLDPKNGYVSVIHEDHNLAKNTYVGYDTTGNLILDFKTQGNPGSNDNIYITFHGYLIQFNKFYTMRLEGMSGSATNWVALFLRLGLDYTEFDKSPSSREFTFNCLFRNNEVVQTYLLKDEDADQVGSSYTRPDGEEYITFRVSKNDDGSQFIFEMASESDPKIAFVADKTVQIPYTQLNKWDFSTTNHMFLGFKKDDDTTGKITWYDRDYESFKIP